MSGRASSKGGTFIHACDTSVVVYTLLPCIPFIPLSYVSHGRQHCRPRAVLALALALALALPVDVARIDTDTHRIPTT